MSPSDEKNKPISRLTRRGFLGATAGIGSLALSDNKLFALLKALAKTSFPVLPTAISPVNMSWRRLPFFIASFKSLGILFSPVFRT